MTGKLAVLISAIIFSFMACGLYAARPAQSTAGGSYSDAQVMSGESLYATQCAACHGVDLTGVPDLFPALIGDMFIESWQERSVGDLFQSVLVTMPALDPGSLTPEQSADVIAYLLNTSGYPSGTDDLTTDQDVLNAIPIGTP